MSSIINWGISNYNFVFDKFNFHFSDTDSHQKILFWINRKTGDLCQVRAVEEALVQGNLWVFLGIIKSIGKPILDTNIDAKTQNETRIIIHWLAKTFDDFLYENIIQPKNRYQEIKLIFFHCRVVDFYAGVSFLVIWFMVNFVAALFTFSQSTLDTVQ